MRAGPLRVAFTVLGLATAAPSLARADAGTEPEPARGSSGFGPEKGVFGIGIIIGEPLGISAKLYLQHDRAIQAAIGSAFIDGGLQGDADFLFHPYVLTTRPSFSLPLYVGPGARIIQYRGGRGEDTHVALGFRAVAGIAFDFTEVPLDTFVEAAVIGEYRFQDGYGAGIGINAGAGVRYYF